MLNNPIIKLLLMFAIFCKNVVSSDNFNDVSVDLKFTPGDVIFCNMVLVLNMTPAKHVLLATSNSTVAHVTGVTAGDKKTAGSSTLKEQNWTEYREDKSISHISCYVKEHATIQNSVERARRDVNRYSGERIFYQVNGCNCEHWVNYWAHGYMYSGQLWMLGEDFQHSKGCQVGSERNLFKVTIAQAPFLDNGSSRNNIAFEEGECFSWMEGGWWNNRVSSVNVLDGKCVRLWDGIGCQGENSCVCGYHPKLAMNDRISSMSSCNGSEQFTLRVHRYPEGSVMKGLTNGVMGTFEELSFDRRGCFSMTRKDWWNNRISGVEVVEGDCVRLWDGKGCTGESVCVCGEELTLPSSIDDKTSSISKCGDEEIVAMVRVFQRSQSNVFGPGANHDVHLINGSCFSLKGSWWDNRITSVDVKFGCVVLWDWEDCEGPHVKVSEIVKKLGTKMNDKTSSISACI